MRKIKIGDFLIWFNWFMLFALLVRVGVLTSYYMEHTKAYKISLTLFISVAVIQAILCCIKYDA